MAEIHRLLRDMESDRVERKESVTDKDKIQQVICAFANDLPDHKQAGYLLIGVDDKGMLAGPPITDEVLRSLAALRDSGNILPMPRMNVERVDVEGRSVAVVQVFPSDSPPVRFHGQVWIRVGPRRAIATREEERRLTERGIAGVHTFDRSPCIGAKTDDLLADVFTTEYLPSAVSRNTIAENQRTIEEQMTSLRLLDLRLGIPTHAGILFVGRNPLQFIPGAYDQFVRFDGKTLADSVQDHKDLTGNLITQLRQLDDLLPLQIRTARAPGVGLQHEDGPDYPLAAIRELTLNAIMHRSYEATNSPVRINWFSDRVEIQNPGGLFGHVTPANFRTTSDYRNPVIAEGMKALGYVERFGTGIARAQAALIANGNREAQFVFEPTHVLVTIWGRE